MKTFGRRTTAVILSVIMILSCFAGLSFSSGALTDGDYTYYVRDDGTISVTNYEGDGTRVTVPSEIDGKPVTQLYIAFKFNSTVESVTIPDTVTDIGYETFYKCTALKEVIIPDSVTQIGPGAFENCTSLTEIKIPESVKDIDYYAFRECTSLTDINIPDCITEIKEGLFEDCPALKTVKIPDGAVSVGDYAFSGCSALESITIPESVTELGYRTFSGCSSLEKITIPASVTDAGMYTFEECTGLKEINVDADNENYKSIDGVLFDKDVTELIEFPCGLGGEYTIPASVNDINIAAFYSCSKLTGITVPVGVKSIPEGAFYNCSSLAYINLPAGLEEICGMAFLACSSLESLSIPDTVTKIEEGAFLNCDSLKSVKIPDSVTEIGKYALSFHMNEDEDISQTDGFVICASKGSAAQTYADENSIKFVDVKACEHTDTVILNAKDASCTEKGYSGDKVCEICGTTVETGTATDALGHIDEDGDGVCDRCSEKMSESKSCGCICHKNGFMKFIYKIFRFFWRIFGIKKSCGCGQLHY